MTSFLYKFANDVARHEIKPQNETDLNKVTNRTIELAEQNQLFIMLTEKIIEPAFNKKKLLETQFTKKGYTYRQIKKDKNVFAYARYNSTGNLSGFEIFRLDPAENEEYPDVTEFGKKIFYGNTVKQAEFLFKWLVDEALV